MNKLLIAVFVLGIAYFAYHKRSQAFSKEVEKVDVVLQPEVSANRVAVSATTTATSATTDTEMATTAESIQESEATDESATEIDEPKENVDQTVIANEKRLASSKSATEVFELLQKLRIRIKKLGAIATNANAESYAKFVGTYEGPVLNRRQESVYKLKLVIKQNDESGMPQISGSFVIDKAKDGIVKGEFKDDFGVQLVGRDGLVINSADEKNYFQIYRLDNSYIAGTYYEKKTRSFKVYRFILR